MKIKRYEFTWIDSIQDNQVWQAIEDVCEEPPDTFKTIGFLIGESKRFYHLALSLHFNDEGVPNRVGTIFRIPKGCVIKKKVLANK